MPKSTLYQRYDNGLSRLRNPSAGLERDTTTSPTKRELFNQVMPRHLGGVTRHAAAGAGAT